MLINIDKQMSPYFKKKCVFTSLMYSCYHHYFKRKNKLQDLHSFKFYSNAYNQLLQK